ncbi:MAG: hypothetical protein ACE5KM_16820 [Planctomycetaceae bacterium]
MTVPDLLETLRRGGVSIRADGDRLRLSPREAVSPELIDELRLHKAEILTRLSNHPDSVTAEDRQAAYEEAVAEATRLYCGGHIDWPSVDAAAELILSASTRRELNAGVQQYVAAVAGDNHENLSESLE